MSQPTREESAKSLGSGRLLNITAGTAQAITDAVITLSDGGSITGTTFAFVASTAQLGPTITDSGNGFVTAGFVVGKSIRVTGAGQAGNNATFVVKGVLAGTLTLDRQTNLTAEAAGATVVISEVVKPDAIKVTSPTTNAGLVFVGPSGVSSANGDVLEIGTSLSIQVADMSKIFVDVASSNDDVTILFLYNR